MDISQLPAHKRLVRRLMLPNPRTSARAWGWLINRAPDWYFDTLMNARVFLERRRQADVNRFFEEQFDLSAKHPDAEDLS